MSYLKKAVSAFAVSVALSTLTGWTALATNHMAIPGGVPIPGKRDKQIQVPSPALKEKLNVRGTIRLIDCNARPEQIRVSVGGRTVTAEIDPITQFDYRYAVRDLPVGSYTVTPSITPGVCPRGVWTTVPQTASGIGTVTIDFTYQVPRRRVTIPSTIFGAVFRNVFERASFTADSCGATRQARLLIPGRYEQTQPLPQLEYTLNDTEKNLISVAFAGALTVTKVMACVHDVSTGSWSGRIEGGKIKIHIPFRDPGHEIRAFGQQAITVPGVGPIGAAAGVDVWREVGGLADDLIPDYNLEGLSVDIFLTAIRDGRGRLSYSDVNVRVNIRSMGFTGAGKTIDVIVDRITGYKDELRRRVEDEIRRAIADDRVRNQVADAIMAEISRAPYNVRTVLAVRGSGTSVELEF